jgi:hypothetical protein
VASASHPVDTAEHCDPAFVIELRSGGVQHGDMAAACCWAEALDRQEGDCRLAGRVVAELEGAGRVGLDAVVA